MVKVRQGQQPLSAPSRIMTWSGLICLLVARESCWVGMKNIVLCCDGTANEFVRRRTNVVKLYYALARDPAQVAY